MMRNDFMERQEDFYVLTFYETLPMPHIGIVVEKQSAVLGLPGEREIKINMHTDHSNICKFEDEEGEDFRPVWQEIQALADAAVENAEQLKALAATPTESINLPVAALGHNLPSKFPSIKLSSLASHHYIERSDLSKRLDDILDTLEDCSNTANVALVQGIAGSGKTQLVTRWAQEWLRKNICCYWFDASSLEILHSGFVDFSMEARLANPSQPLSLESTIRQVINYISELEQGWLLIFDNFDIPAKQSFSLRKFFPEGSRGRIIVTSRNTEVNDDVGGQLLHVDVMRDEEAIKLLKKSAGLLDGGEEAEQETLEHTIATDLLGSLPLAIAQGGAFIKKVVRGPSNVIRLRQYISTFRNHIAKMLSDKYGSLISQYGKSVITSWDMSFHVVMSDNNTAAQLFLLMGFLHHSNIPRHFFGTVHNSKAQLQKHDGIDIENPPLNWLGDILKSGTDGCWDETAFNVAMAVLESFSLLRTVNSITYSVHPLVHAWTKISQHSIAELDMRAGLALSMLAKVHDRNPDKYSIQRRSTQAAYSNHLASCVESIQHYTELLSPQCLQGPRAVTLMRIANIVGGEALASEYRAQKLDERLTLLAFLNGLRMDGIDHISSLQALRNLLINLAEKPQYGSTILPLIAMLSTLLAHAASTDPVVDLIEQQLSLKLTELKVCKQIGKGSELHNLIQDILTFLETHRNDLGLKEFLINRGIVLGALETLLQPSEIPEILIKVNTLLSEMEKNLGNEDVFHVFKAKTCKAACLGRAGKMAEALELARDNLAIAQMQPGVSNHIITQCVFNLNHLLIREEKYADLAGNCEIALRRIADELGPYHEQALLEKRRILQFSRWHKNELDLTTTLSDPQVFGDDHCHELPNDLVTISIELAIAYKAFDMEQEIEPLWNGVLRQAELSNEGEELISIYIQAFQVAVDTAHRQGYHEYASSFEKLAAQLQVSFESSKNAHFEPPYLQLKRLREFWGDLLEVYETQTSPSSPISTLPSTTKLLSRIDNCTRETKTAALFLINHFLEWMIQSDACTTSAPFSPVSCLVLRRLEALSSSQFGPWYDSTNTLRVRIALTICERLSGQESGAIKSEDSMLRYRIEEEKSEPRHIPGRHGVHLVPGTLGIERLHIEYRRRKWYSASLRMYRITYDDFVDSLGIESETTVLQLKFICVLHAKLDIAHELEVFLQPLENDLQIEDPIKRGKILDAVRAASEFCRFNDTFESSWYLIRWLIRCGWAMTNLRWRIQISQDYINVSEKLGKDEDVEFVKSQQKICELVVETSEPFSLVQLSTEQISNLAQPGMSRHELLESFKLIGERFCQSTSVVGV